jgi:hypothetical protein
MEIEVGFCWIDRSIRCSQLVFVTSSRTFLLSLIKDRQTSGIVAGVWKVLSSPHRLVFHSAVERGPALSLSCT